jgi:hypothetical protein
MRSNAAMKLEPKQETVPLSERGRIMYVEDVMELTSKSRWWVLNSFAPDKKRRMGRTPYWWEKDVVEALDSENFE